MFEPFFGFVLILIAAAIWRRVHLDLRELHRRVELLELTARSLPPPLEISAPPPAEGSEPAPVAAPIPLPIPPAPATPHKPRDLTSIEDVVGGVWLQNLGAVLLLLGVFFLIVWGWSTGRLGPEVLIAAGVLTGAILVWRGDRLRRSLPGLGHAFIGIGLGVAYLTLYLGHFTLRVLPAPVAIVALLIVSWLALMAGLHYRVQTIAALGVVGAYLPQLASGLLPLGGFSLPPAALLGWIAAISLLVFALAARAGWSGLDLTALVLAAVAWLGSNPGGGWGWPITIGLAVLFAALGLAPIPRLVRIEGRVRPVDLAVIAAAPLMLLVSTWPMLAFANPRFVALLLLSLAALYAAAAAWVDVRRPERDLWRPLTGAATLFLTAALERALGPDFTPVVWSVEGALLLTLGLAPRSGWLRFCGAVVLALGGIWGLAQIATSVPGAPLPMTPLAVRTLVIVVAVLLTAHRLAARRGELSFPERYLPEFVTGAGHALLAVWFTHESWALGRALEGPSGAWRQPPAVVRPHGSVRADALAFGLSTLAWTAQAAWLAWRGAATRRVALRVIAGFFLGLSTLGSLFALVALDDPWSSDWLPVLHAPALLQLAALALVVATAGRLASQRESLLGLDRRSPEMWGLAAAVVLLAWTSREADHVARAMLGMPGHEAPSSVVFAPELRSQRSALAPVFTSVGWLIQALLTTAVGWWRGSAFLRWMGLALVGVTAIKFVFSDLADADPFWRFLTAIAAGAVMLVMSWSYQRKRREARAAAGNP